jgi:rhamnogalacturonyl hydrolase YesR
MFVYAIQQAVDQGWVSAGTYAPVARRGYEGIVSKARVNSEGLVDIGLLDFPVAVAGTKPELGVRPAPAARPGPG